MKLHKGDIVEITKRMAFNWTPYLEIKVNGYVQQADTHEYILKRSGLTEAYCLRTDYTFITIKPKK